MSVTDLSDSDVLRVVVVVAVLLLLLLVAVSERLDVLLSLPSPLPLLVVSLSVSLPVSVSVSVSLSLSLPSLCCFFCFFSLLPVLLSRSAVACVPSVTVRPALGIAAALTAGP